MLKYYSKIFYKKNTPRSFNVGIFFPLFASILSTMAVIIISSIMDSMETQVANTIISINGKSAIYIKEKEKGKHKEKFAEIQGYLRENGKNSNLIVKRKSLLNRSDTGISEIVTVIGVEDLNEISGSFNLLLDEGLFK